jgi:hypothetical protein
MPIAPNKKNVRHDSKQSEPAWLQTGYSAGEVFQISSLQCELDVDALYQEINFESETGF